MFGVAGRRAAEAIVGLFAVLGFAFVPLGHKTALEHTRDIFTTPAALTALRELTAATAKLRAKLVATLLAPPRPAEPASPAPSGPRPKLPELPGG